MLEVCLLGIVIVGLISFKVRLDEFNQSYNTQKLAFETFNSCENGMTIEELNEKFGKKAYKCFGKSNKYRWHFGKGIIVRKNNNIVPYSEFSENIENHRDYSLHLGNSYIEMDFDNGKSIGGKVVGLN